MTVTVATLAERVLRRLGVSIVRVADRPTLSSSYTPEDIATRVLLELGVIASDETPASTDQAAALAAVNAVQDSLVSQGLVSWSSSFVPRAIAEEITKLAAVQLAPAFGKQSGGLAVYQALEARVRAYSVQLGAVDLATEAVMAVHQQLDAMGLMRWSVFDIPDGVAEAYVQRAAVLLAPAFGQRPDPTANLESLRAFARFSALPASDAPTPADYF